MSIESLKKQAALAALEFIPSQSIIGVGSGSTVNYFIEGLAKFKNKIDGAVASSIETAKRLTEHRIPLLDLNFTGNIPVYIDGADEVNPYLQLIKGGGGAHTREKIVASCSQEFICIVDESKQVEMLQGPLPIEVIPMARSYVARELVKIGGFPVHRPNFTTDNGNQIIDVHHLPMIDLLGLDQLINNITGVIAHGLFAKRPVNTLIVAHSTGVKIVRSAKNLKRNSTI